MEDKAKIIQDLLDSGEITVEQAMVLMKEDQPVYIPQPYPVEPWPPTAPSPYQPNPWTSPQPWYPQVWYTTSNTNDTTTSNKEILKG